MPEAFTSRELEMLVVNSVVMLIAFGMIAMLFLARWCQAALYNPGGFRKEFHQIRLSQTAGAILLLALIISYGIDDLLGRWLPVLTLPLVIAALSLVHFLMAAKQLSNRWLVAFYLTLLLFGQIFYPLLIFLGLLDSALNLRTRLQPIQRD